MKDKALTNSLGQLHCDDGPAVEWTDGQKEWWVNGELHRLDGPAIEAAYGHHDHQEWWVDGKRHRLDGPAIDYRDGGKAYHIAGRRFNPHDYPVAVIAYVLKCSGEAAEELYAFFKNARVNQR